MKVKDHYLIKTHYPSAPFACVIVLEGGGKIESSAFVTKIEAEKELARLIALYQK